ncbi:MAG: mechanosensitive ion channel family protein [Acidimicrobiia bacterium]|nr:mechanosensitive ion channel family protein [Acidimicrobiia bacterium]MYK55975.1 mechanosensitive ion channel family protein [Acidimicrobiia bacterium]
MPLSIVAQEEQPEDVTQLIDHVGWYEWILAFLVVMVALIGGRLIRRALSRGLAKTAVPLFAAIVLGKTVVYLAVVVGLYFALTILRLQVGPLIGALGLAGLALAFAFQDILENFIAGLLMLMRRPIKVGDEMESSGYKGDVNDMTLRAVAIDTFDGDRVYIPNSMVWKNPLVNFTETPLRRTTLVVGVAYRTDLDFAQQVLQEAIDNVEGVVIPPAATVEFVEFNNSSIDFYVRYWHASDRPTLWAVRDRAGRAMKKALDAAGIEIPFPQRTLWFPEGLGDRSDQTDSQPD